MFLGKLVWYRDFLDEDFQPVQNYFDISNLEELSQIFNQLEKQGINEKKVMNFCMFLPSRITLNIYLCGDKVMLDYFNPEKIFQCCRWNSVGHENDDGVFCFYKEVSSEWIKISRHHLVSSEQAKYALQYFVKTGGQLTDEIKWENPIEDINDDNRNYDDPFDADIPF